MLDESLHSVIQRSSSMEKVSKEYPQESNVESLLVKQEEDEGKGVNDGGCDAQEGMDGKNQPGYGERQQSQGHGASRRTSMEAAPYDFNDPMFSTDEFRVWEMKIRKCPKSRPHDWTMCPFAHPVRVCNSESCFFECDGIIVLYIISGCVCTGGEGKEKRSKNPQLLWNSMCRISQIWCLCQRRFVYVCSWCI